MFKKEAYQRLSDMVYKGFLTMTFNLSGKSFVLKTVNEKEYDLIKLYSGIKDDNYINRFNMYYFIFSLFLVDGENVLKDRHKRVKELYDFFQDLPSALYTKMAEELKTLRVSAEESVDFLEGFSFTDQSRRMWKLMQNNLPSSENLTGIPGTGKLGLNVYQENWILINKMLDDEEEYDRNFSLAILIASATNPKGCRSVGSKHDAQKQNNRERREKMAREGSSEEQKWKPTGWAAPVDTAEELIAELMRQMEGKKDKHDLFIEEHMRKVREKADKQAQEVEKKLDKIRKKRKEEGGPSISSSQRELSEKESKELMFKNPNNLLLIPDNKDEEQERFFKKVGSKILTARK